MSRYYPNCGYQLPAEKPEITLTRTVQTCWGCPSQWDAWDADGTYYYLRYSWGTGTVERNGNEVVARFSCAPGWDGIIELEEFARLAGIKLAGDPA